MPDYVLVYEDPSGAKAVQVLGIFVDVEDAHEFGECEWGGDARFTIAELNWCTEFESVPARPDVREPPTEVYRCQVCLGECRSDSDMETDDTAWAQWIDGRGDMVIAHGFCADQRGWMQA